MSEKKSLLILGVAVFAILAISVPLQYLMRKEVVVGLASDAAHSHAHGEEGHSHADEASGEEGDEDEHAHEHTAEEGHLATEVPLGVNLVPNYGFESGTYGQIWTWMSAGADEGGTLFRDDSVARSGMASAAISTNGVEIDGAGWLMRLDELPLDHMVILEGYIKTEGLEGAAFLRLTLETKEEGGDEPLVLGNAYSDAVAGDSDWTFCSVRIYVPVEVTGVWLEADMYGRGIAWFDDLSLVVEEAEEVGEQGG